MEPRETSTKTRGRRILAPALTLLVTAAVVTGAGVAGAAADAAAVHVTESGQCFRFTEAAGHAVHRRRARRGDGRRPADMVTWDFNTGTALSQHRLHERRRGDPGMDRLARRLQQLRHLPR